MFINCPFCNALVATDPATDLAPERCPRCAVQLRGANAVATAAAEPLAAPRPECAPPDPVVAAGDGCAPPEEDGQAAPDAGPDAQHAVAIHDDPPAEAPDAIAASAVDGSVAAAQPPRQPGSGAAAAGEEVVPDAAAEARTTGHPPSGPAADALPGPPRRARGAPSFAQSVATAPQRVRTGTPARVLAVMSFLALLLVLQLLLAGRDRLAADARWRPWISTLCGALGCGLPAWREPSAFTLVERDVRPHPTLAGVLRVTASFRNDARWPQAWPGLALTLSNLDGREAGRRTFSADEYLGARPTQGELQAGQVATIVMDVMEPAPRIVAFAFEFE